MEKNFRIYIAVTIAYCVLAPLLFFGPWNAGELPVFILLLFSPPAIGLLTLKGFVLTICSIVLLTNKKIDRRSGRSYCFALACCTLACFVIGVFMMLQLF